MALPSQLSMLSPVATLSARHPAQRAIAVAISSFGTELKCGHRLKSAGNRGTSDSPAQNAARGPQRALAPRRRRAPPPPPPPSASCTRRCAAPPPNESTGMSIDREYAQIQVRHRVVSGFWPPEEIAETVLEECFDPAEVTSDDEAWVRQLIERAFAAQREAEKT